MRLENMNQTTVDPKNQTRVGDSDKHQRINLENQCGIRDSDKCQRIRLENQTRSRESNWRIRLD